jgi:hypothetical protein
VLIVTDRFEPTSGSRRASASPRQPASPALARPAAA